MAKFPITAMMNGRRQVINPIGAIERQRITGHTVFVINLTDLAWPAVQRSYGHYTVPAKKAGEPYAVLEVHGRIEPTDTGEDRIVEQSFEADDIAADICREINENCPLAPEGQSYLGLFVSKTRKPSAAQLEQEMQKLRTYQEALVAAAFKFWGEEKEHKNVTGMHRWAGRQLGIKAEWIFSTVVNVECRACHELIPPNSPKCPKCHAVLDLEKMKEFFPLEYAEITDAKKSKKAAPAQN